MSWLLGADGLQISPARAPYTPRTQQNELQIKHDKHYGMHGKVMALIIISIFSLLILSLIFVPYLRRRRARGRENVSESSEPVRWWSHPLSMLKNRRFS
ncbi:hypothetical protein RHGRI_036198 [Rhododendron griersonianum]|uniref:Uncharacterized protein n=1 Tax=Rhododendron griersonianum TaxID=479676 RepID=A0AAV6HST0_9ERIC|nr:hypothetical protein RHGRI_036198 [Rhododendron griersonianum]